MKRLGILLVVMAVLIWCGLHLAHRNEPAASLAIQPPATAANEPAPEPKADPLNSSRSLSDAEKKAQQESWFGTRVIIAAQRAVKASLEVPDSARFKEVRANYTEAFGVVACGWVNSRNASGNNTGFRRFISAGGNAMIEGRDNIADEWKAQCL